MTPSLPLQTQPDPSPPVTVPLRPPFAPGDVDRALAPILAEWQAEIQFAVEAGVAPSLGVGGGSGVPATLVGLEAIRLLAEQRQDMTSPVVMAGGSNGAWLWVLMQPERGDAAQSPPLVALFSGQDEATQIATAGTLPRPPAGLFPPGNRSLPDGFRPHVAPALQSAAPLQWDTLSLHVLEPAPSALGAMPMGPLSGWLALLFVALLILGALAL